MRFSSRREIPKPFVSIRSVMILIGGLLIALLSTELDAGLITIDSPDRDLWIGISDSASASNSTCKQLAWEKSVPLRDILQQELLQDMQRQHQSGMSQPSHAAEVEFSSVAILLTRLDLPTPTPGRFVSESFRLRSPILPGGLFRPPQSLSCS